LKGSTIHRQVCEDSEYSSINEKTPYKEVLKDIDFDHIHGELHFGARADELQWQLEEDIEF